MKTSFLLIVLLFVNSIWAVPSKSKSDAQRIAIRLVELKSSELKKRLHAQVDQVAKTLKNPDAVAIQNAHQKVESVNLVDSITVFIAKRFSATELKELSKFLETSTGQKFLPFIVASEDLFVAYGSLIGMDVFEVLRKAHPQQLNNQLNMSGVTTSAKETIRRLQDGKSK